jgi:nucleoid-associated protein YgaU
MMRKDVRFGLTIGGVLLAALVIWAAVFDRGVSDKTSPVAMAPANPTPDQTQTPLQTTNTPAIGDTTSSAAATQPVSTDASSGAHDWDMLLANGGSTTQPAMLSASVPVDSAMVTEPADAPATRPSLTAAGTHKVLPGESFFTIAAKVYGDSKYYARLEDANPTVNPNRLRVGTVINVPDLKTPIAPRPASSATASAAASKAPAAAVARAPVDPTKSYRVRPSDTLMAIARKLYGDELAWQKIYDANKDVIGPNPARLKVDMVLRLPEPPTVTLAN